VNLYPVLHGLEPGRHYRYRVFDGETRSVAEVEQRVLAYETSELFEGPAYRLETRLHGQKVSTWIDAEGLPQFELSLNGVLISALEPAQRAQDYLLKAALIKDDTLLHFSRVPVQPPLQAPRDSRRMSIRLKGISAQPLALDAPGQECQATGDQEILCRTRRLAPGSGPTAEAGAEDLASTLIIPSGNSRIQRLAEQIVAGAGDQTEAVQLIIAWMSHNLEQAAADSFSALDVLDQGKAECQGHSFLYASLARAVGIPTRVVNGLVYHPDYQGFLYHTWAESLLQGTWLPVDPTFGQLGADATHLRLLVGENLADLLPLLDVIGRLQAQVLELE
jgi:transglutaminase-like putative cysteine protease